jgi:phytoene synthase
MNAARALTRPALLGGTRPGEGLSAARTEARAILAKGSKSFALAGALLGRRARADAAVLYAFCRRADDAVDEAAPGTLDTVLADLRAELAAIYRGDDGPPLRRAMAELVARRRIPRSYLDALLDGFAMDARNESYGTLAALDRYGYRVAGVVGLMMCHVLGVRDDRCLPAAAYLGMAMQLTNIARDVVEDHARGRQYLPRSLVRPEELARALATSDADHPSRRLVAQAVGALLDRAEGYYEQGLRGLSDLRWRDALAIGAAARIYRAIGGILRLWGGDVRRGRAVVSLPRKLALVAAAAWASLWSRGRAPTALQVPGKEVRFDALVIP